jgi:hypothetical protein
MMVRRLLAFGLALAALCLARPLAAQQVDVVRGRITSPEGQPVEGAQITVTTVDGGVSRTARTDRNGRFMVTVPGGEGDYYVQVAAIGFLAKRFEIKRVADEEILLADAKLNRNVNELETVRVQGARERPTRNDNSADIGGSEKRVESGQLTADQLGNLAPMAIRRASRCSASRATITARRSTGRTSPAPTCRVTRR